MRNNLIWHTHTVRYHIILSIRSLLFLEVIVNGGASHRPIQCQFHPRSFYSQPPVVLSHYQIDDAVVPFRWGCSPPDSWWTCQIVASSKSFCSTDGFYYLKSRTMQLPRWRRPGEVLCFDCDSLQNYSHECWRSWCSNLQSGTGTHHFFSKFPSRWQARR